MELLLALSEQSFKVFGTVVAWLADSLEREGREGL
jgi:hypothetical protein